MDQHEHVSGNISFPSEQCLHQIFQREVRRNPQSTALIFGEEKMSYAELDHRSDQVAAQLLQFGTQPEDFVALYLERSFELIIGIFGILKAGGAYVPIDVDYPAERMAFMVQDAQAKVILTQSSLKNQLPRTEAKIICLDQVQEEISHSALAIGHSPQALAYMIYTSGSTGKPKGVMITHENVCNQLEGQQAIAPEPISKMMLTCSISFDVSVLTIFWTLLQGAPLVLPRQGEEKDMAQLAETISRNRVTHILTLPSLYTLLLEQAPTEKLQTLRLVNVSGEVCPVSLAQRSEELLPNNQLYNLYGPTEATVNCTYFKFPKGFGEAKAPIGKPILNYEIFILDEKMEAVPRGEVGEVYIGGTKPVVGRGYWNRPELTAKCFRLLPASSKGGGVGDALIPPPWEGGRGRLYKTGDLARWQPDGNIEFLGRSDFQVKYRGFRIELGEVETAIGQHEAVKETIVLLRNQHEVNNQKLVAYLTLHPDRSLTVSELREFLETTLPEYMLPSNVVFLEKMPLTTNGKFDRNALPEPATERPELAEAFVEPEGELEKFIVEKWEVILGVSPIGRNDKFFELGGTSIQAAKFIGEMMSKLNSSIFVTTIFDYPTVASYAEFLEKKFPEKIAALTKATLPKAASANHPLSGGLTAQQIEAFPELVPSHLQTTATGQRPTANSQQPIFILAPPRSGTTLLRVMLAGHPDLFACNELQLLHFQTLAERAKAYSGKFSLWSEGLVRAVMELENLEVDEAKFLLQTFAKQGTTTTEMYEKLHIWLNSQRPTAKGKQLQIVDKSPSYALDPLALEKAISDFPNARFIHLVRHPYSMVKSFEKYGMDQVLYLHPNDLSAREMGELVWLHSHRNTLEFLKKIPDNQQYRIVYEDLVRNPEKTMREMCGSLGIDFHENLLNPYRDLDQKMTDGIHADSRSMGDTNFDQKEKIDPSKADDWKGVLEDNFLSEQTWELNRQLTNVGVHPDEERIGAKAEGENLTAHFSPLTSKKVAIIGMSCRLPGAKNIEQFWRNLIENSDIRSTVTVSTLREEGLPQTRNSSSVTRTFALEKPYEFDAAFFGYLPKEAELTDPQHRQFLETAYEALESAGYDPFRYAGKIGVFGGVARNTYFQNNVATNPDRLEEAGGYQEMLAAESTFSISRVAYKLNLRGPAVNVQTACSTGGVAVHLACQSLLSGDSDMVIVGGGRVQAPVLGGYEYVDGGPLSPDGTLRAFDAGANGMVQGHGMAMLVLKPLEKAIEDGDHIWSVIRSSAINNDGADKSGITAPSSKGQAECIAEAIRKAGLQPSDIGYVEAHGTGTFLGDPIEIQGLREAFVTRTCSPCPSTSRTKSPCYVGSVKTNVGHLDAGACIAGIIKTSLALFHGVIPATLNFQAPNPQLDLENSPFEVNGKNVDWPRTEVPRRAGVSSFGLGGTNAHIVLEEAPIAVTPQPPSKGGDKESLEENTGRIDSQHPSLFESAGNEQVSSLPSPLEGGRGVTQSGSFFPLLLSAKTETALENSVSQLQDFLKKHPETILADAGFTLAVGRPAFRKRKVLVKSTDSTSSAVSTVTGNSEHAGKQFIFMFPGGGSQYVDMARDLFDSNDFFRKEVNRCFEILKKNHGLEIQDLVFPNQPASSADRKPKTKNLENPSTALPALLSIEIALARLWQHWGIEPTEMIGHSMGEYAAAHLAGVMSLEDALGLVAVRGRLFDSLEVDGCMLSVALAEERLRPYLSDDHTISVINKPDSLVVSGTTGSIGQLEENLTNEGIDCRKILIAVPAHSPLIDPILSEFRKYLQSVDFQPPTIPFVSNVTGTWITPEQATSPDYWLRHLRQTVRFADGMATLKKLKNRIFLEVGPGQTLSTFARAIPTLRNRQSCLAGSPREVGLPSKFGGHVIASVRHPKEVRNDVEFILRSVAKLWVGGIEINWTNFFAEGRKRIPLPTYPFDHKKYFIAPCARTVNPQIRREVFAEGENQLRAKKENTPVFPMGAPLPQNSMGNTTSRIPSLIQEIKETLHELSGLEPADMDAEATFLELGFDSLFLSQAVIKFNYKFKTKLSFRALFEEAPTIQALAEHVDGVLPEEMYQAKVEDPEVVENQVVEQKKSQQLPVPDLSNFQNLTNLTPDIQRLFQQQLAIMQQQLELLQGRSTGGTFNVDGFPSGMTNEGGANQKKEVTNPPIHQSTNSPIRRSAKGVTAKMNSYKKIAGGDGLTEKQQAGLEKFMAKYEAMTKNSKHLAQRHREVYADPRGVTGFSKLWKEICYQIAHERSKGAMIWDMDGNEYIDYVMSYGVALFGHMPDFVEEAVIEAVRKGNSIDLLPPQATEMARIICDLTGYDRVTLANTGSEAVLAAVRAARTATGRGRIAVFDTDYHGYLDQFLVRGVHLRGKSKTLPSSPGVPDYNVENVLVLDYDDPEVMQKLEAEIDELACVLIEPVQAQNPHWQHGELIREIRKITENQGVALIFDEIINGFRMHQRGAQGWYGVDADISAYGKSISGGLPISAVAGKAKFMDAFDGGMWRYGDDSSPDGVITYFASTFIKNPISVAAGWAAMREIERLGPALSADLNAKTIEFAERIREIFLKTKAPLMIQSCSSFFMIKNADGSPLTRLFNYVLRTHGVNIRERPCFISTAHTAELFEQTYEAFEAAILEMMELGLMEPWDGEDFNVIVGSRQLAVGSPSNEASTSRTEPFSVPTTEGQQEIFLSDKFSPEASKAYNIATEIRLEGEQLDVERMRACLQALVDRHEALRTTFAEDGESQVILPKLEVEIPVVDLTADSTSSAVSSVSQLQDEEAEHHFDLVNGPLVRFKIVLLEEDVSLVFIHVHHIICDGWSLGILTRELGEMYGTDMTPDSHRDQNLLNLENPKQLSQYVTEQADLQQLSVFKDNEKYWLDQFADGVPVLDLPTDFTRPPVKTYHGAVEKKSFDSETVKRIRKVAARQGTTFYVFMLAAYQAYLSRISGQSDLVVGVAAAGHNLPGNANLVAHAIGLLPVRSKVREGMTFAEYLKSVRGQFFDAFDHQQFTFGALVKKLKIARDVSRPTLVSVAFNLDSPLDNLAFGNMRSSTRAIPRHYETFDTFINLKPLPAPLHGLGVAGLDFEWNFNTDLFRRETIRLRLDEFETFLNGILEDAERPLSSLRLLPDFESNQIAAFGQGKTADFPLHRCLHELFEEQVAKTPDAIAVQDAEASLTYRELSERSTALAQILLENGCKPGDFVGLILEQSVEMLVGIYGILKAGGAYVPIDPRNPSERIAFTLQDAGCQLLVTERNVADELPDFDGEVIFTSDKFIAGRDLTGFQNLSGLSASSPAYVIYTSGSTGRPKGVVVRHENAVNSLFAINENLNLGEADTVFSVSSMSFDMSIPDYFLTLICGAKLVLAGEQTKKDGFALREAVEQAKPTFMQATPTTWKILMLSGWEGSADLIAVAGGEGFPKDLAGQMAEKCKAVWNGYGPTETTIYATWQKISEEHLANCPGEFAAIGSPIANVEMWILDEHGEQVPVGVPGELYIGGSGVTSGYVTRTASPSQPSKFVARSGRPCYATGDRCRFLPTGEIEFLGRIDGQVKIRGYRIELGEIEEVMKQFSGVSNAAVAIFAEGTDNQQLVAYFVRSNENGNYNENEKLKAYLRSKLPGYMVPTHFVEMEQLPQNTSLKVDRKALPKPDFSNISRREKQAASTPGEKLLTDLWQDLLGVPEVSVQDDFFELGGHSLVAVQLMSRIREATGKKLPLTTLFQHSTIEKLATQLNGFNKSGNGQANGQSNGHHVEQGQFSSLITIQKGNPQKPVLYLVHGGGLHVLFYQNMVKYLDADQPIYALQAKGLNGDEAPLDNIEDMAAHYIREILLQNPDGMYCLAGYSLGGLIAWEMAKQLKAMGKTVPQVSLFDAVAKYEWAGASRNWKKKLKKTGFNLSLLVKDPAKALEYKSHVLKMQFQHLKGKMRTAYRNNRTNEIEEGYIPYGKEVYAKSLEAYEKYELKPLDIHVDLFKAKEQMFYLDDPEFYGWNRFAKQGVTIHEIEGNHLTLFDEPHGKEVAGALKTRLSEITKAMAEKEI